MNKHLSLNIFKGNHGGCRPNSGRKWIHSKGVAHRKSEVIKARHPLHVNFKFKANVRSKETLKTLKKSISNAFKHGLNIIHYSFQSNHVHLIIEGESTATLTKGMRSLTITMAKGLKRGRIQLERYHLHVLKTLAETKNAINYVLFNEQHHSGKNAHSEMTGFMISRSRTWPFMRAMTS
jgi:REP element-mobilizing transposase RayT